MIKHDRYVERDGKKVRQVFLVPGLHPVTGKLLRCPAGPGLRPIPESGRWYDVSDYLWRRLHDGGCLNVEPPAEPKSEKLVAKEASKRAAPKPKNN